MDFLQNGVRTLKRHSIANISDVLRSHIHRDSIIGLGRRSGHCSAADFPVKNADFAYVSGAVVHLFQQKKLQENEMTTLQDAVRNLVSTEAGPLIYDYYKDNMVKKGMVILRERIKGDSDAVLLASLGQQWDCLYKEILPMLQAIFQPITTKTLTVRQVTLLEFRNTVVLKLPIKEALEALTSVPPALQQMLLVLYNVPESPCTDNAIEVEKLLARVTSPFLGILGLYYGGSEPVIQSNFKHPAKAVSKYPQPLIQVTMANDLAYSDDDLSGIEHRTKKHHMSPLVQTPRHHKRSLGLLHHPLLTAVQEQDRGQIRRFSIATT